MNLKTAGLVLISAFAANFGLFKKADAQTMKAKLDLELPATKQIDTLHAGDRVFNVMSMQKKPGEKNLVNAIYGDSFLGSATSVAIINLSRNEIYFDTDEQRDVFLKDEKFTKDILPDLTAEKMEENELMPAWQYMGKNPQLVVQVWREDNTGNYRMLPYNSKEVNYGTGSGTVPVKPLRPNNP